MCRKLVDSCAHAAMPRQLHSAAWPGFGHNDHTLSRANAAGHPQPLSSLHLAMVAMSVASEMRCLASLAPALPCNLSSFPLALPHMLQVINPSYDYVPPELISLFITGMSPCWLGGSTGRCLLLLLQPACATLPPSQPSCLHQPARRVFIWPSAAGSSALTRCCCWRWGSTC